MLSTIVLYLAAITVFFLAAFWRPHVGLYFLVPLLPLQTVRYRLHPFPLGEKLVDIILLAVILGLFVQRKGRVFPKTPLNGLLVVWAVFYYVSLWRGAFFLGSSLPLWISDPRFSNWKNYMIMPLVFLVVGAAIKDKKQIKILLVLMMLTVLRANVGFWNTIAERDFSHFSYGLRYAGVFGYAGENGLGAFEAQLALFSLGFYSFIKNKHTRWGLLAFAALCTYCLVFSFSRGAYLGFLAGLLFLGLVRERKLLLALIAIALSWQALVPNAVVQRVFMTYDNGQLESSANERVTIWKDAVALVPQYPLFGTGFDTYEFMGRTDYSDTHNLYLKILVETGSLGLMLFLFLLSKCFWLSFRLFRVGQDPFFRALGLGTAAYIVCALIANLFGDRWTYLQVNGYLWTFLGLIIRAHILTEESSLAAAPEPAQEPAEVPILVPA